MKITLQPLRCYIVSALCVSAVGMTFLALFLLGLCAGFLFVMRRRRKKRAAVEDVFKQGQISIMIQRISNAHFYSNLCIIVHYYYINIDPYTLIKLGSWTIHFSLCLLITVGRLMFNCQLCTIINNSIGG